jgi:hypothetical protein
MEKITLSYVGRFTTAKDGSPLVSKKTGKPYTSLRIKCNEYGDKYLSGFDSFATKDWKEGMTVECDVEQKGEYLNFSVPRPEQVNAGRMTELENKLTTLTLRFNKLMSVLVDKGVLEMPKQNVPGTDIEYPEAPKGQPFEEDPLEGDDPFKDLPNTK